MPCTEANITAEQRRAPAGVKWSAVVALAALAAGCATPAPPPAPSPAPPAAAPSAQRPAAPAPQPPRAAAPAPSPAVTPAAAPTPSGVGLGPRVALPAAPTVRTWDEFKRLAGRRMVAASPQASYMGKPPPMLFGIPILEIELNGDGSVRSISVTRPPANPDAANTTDYAMEAVRRGAPYGDISKLPKPWKWTEVFLFNDKRQFKPRSLD